MTDNALTYSMVKAADLLRRMAQIEAMSDYMVDLRELRAEMDELVRRGYVAYAPRATLYSLTIPEGLAAARRYEELVGLIFEGEL